MLWLVKAGNASRDHNHVQQLGRGPLSTESPPSITSPSTSAGSPTLRDKVLVTARGWGWGAFLKCAIACQKRGDSSVLQIYEVKVWLRRNTRQELSGDIHPHHLPRLSCNPFFHQWRVDLILCCHPSWVPKKVIMIQWVSVQRAQGHCLELYPLKTEHSTSFTQSFLFKHSFRQCFFQYCSFIITLLSPSPFPCSTQGLVDSSPFELITISAYTFCLSLWNYLIV